MPGIRLNRVQLGSNTTPLPPSNHAPTDISLSASSIAENNAVGDVIGALSTTDQDSGNTFTYTLVSGTGSTDNASFSITGANLKAGIAFDYETKSSYSVRIRTTDQDGLYFEKVFTISVSNVTEAPAITYPTQTDIIDVSATVGSTIDCKGLATTWSIEYGSTTAYGNTQAGGTTSANGAKTVQLTGLTPNTLLHWRFKAVNEDGTSYGADQTLTTLANYAKVFNGSNSSISFSYISDYALGSNDFIIKVKFKGLLANNSSLRTIASSNSTTDNKRSWFLGVSAGSLVFYMCADGVTFQTNTTTGNLLDGNYHEIYVCKVNQRMSLAIDGVLISVSTSGTIPSTIYSNSKPITIGSSANSPVSLVFNGSIGDVTISKQSGDLDLFLFAGQSNMTGFDNSLSELPSELLLRQPNIFSYDTEAGSINNLLVIPVSTYWGSEIQFGYKAFESGKNIAIVKVSQGATGFGEGQWIKNGSMYVRLINAYNATKSALEAKGYTVRVRALLFMQGENDTRSTAWANAYATNFDQFIADLKTDLSIATLPVVMGKIHDKLPTGGADGKYDYSTIVREQQELLSSQGKVTLINTDDLTLKADSVHFNGSALISLGNRFYDAAAQYMTSTPFRAILKTRMSASATVTDESVNGNNGAAVNVTSEII